MTDSITITLHYHLPHYTPGDEDDEANGIYIPAALRRHICPDVVALEVIGYRLRCRMSNCRKESSTVALDGEDLITFAVCIVAVISISCGRFRRFVGNSGCDCSWFDWFSFNKY